MKWFIEQGVVQPKGQEAAWRRVEPLEGFACQEDAEAHFYRVYGGIGRVVSANGRIRIYDATEQKKWVVTS